MKQSSYLFSSSAESLASVERVASWLRPYISNIKSMMDVGSGPGCWGKIMEEWGLDDITLVDHPSLSKDMLLVSKNCSFVPVDMETSLPPRKSVDLVVCTEVLEHFNEARAIEIFEYIVTCSDLILFSAAIPGQGGVGHLNEQRHGYWHERFRQKGFEYFDGFKAEMAQDANIIFYLRQNLFLYFRPTEAHRFGGRSNTTAPDMELVHTQILMRPLSKMELIQHLHLGVKRFLKRIGLG